MDEVKKKFVKISKTYTNRRMIPVVIRDQALEDVQLAYNHLELQEIDLGEKLLKYIEEYIKL